MTLSLSIDFGEAMKPEFQEHLEHAVESGLLTEEEAIQTFVDTALAGMQFEATEG